MRPIRYHKPGDEIAALAALTGDAAAIAGGTGLLDLLKLDVARPEVLVDLGALPLAAIEPIAGGGLRIGALARNSDVADAPAVRAGWPLLSAAILAGASPQIRNMATVGGNLNQRTRCPYFRDVTTACNKREPGTGCAALEGDHRSLAILGVSEHCIASHPSDMNVALAALDAVVQVRGPGGARAIPIDRFHREPGDRPEVDTTLAPGELVIAVDLPRSRFARHAHYLKVRDRASYAFALVSVAAAVDLDGGIVRAARIALGGVATRPWRAYEAESSLVGKRFALAQLESAAARALDGARARPRNAFKIELARRSIVRALAIAGGAM
jgi:xanthine dehydrogenase YagS FAD-binding subunit